MIKLMFEKQKQIIIFIINNRKVEAVIKSITLPYYPMNLLESTKLIMNSRNKIPANMITLFKLPKVDEEEFNKAKDDLAIKEILIKDSKWQGANFVKEVTK